MITDFYNDFKKFYQTEKCVACDSIVIGNSYFFSKVWTDDFSRKMSIYICNHCGFAYSYPFIDNSEEMNLYQDYPSHHTHEDILENKVDLFQKVRLFFESHIVKIFFRGRKFWMRKILSCFLFQRMFQAYPIFCNSKNPKLLDIGCGDGAFLMLVKRYSWDCYGTEYHDNLIKRLKIKGIEAKKNLEDFIGKQQFDIIRMSHVLEHLNDPNKTLEIIYKLLKNDGILIIGVPNFTTISKAFREHYALHLPYHRYHFSELNIKILLNRHGFKTIYYKTKSIGVFSASLIRKYKKFRLSLALRIIDIFFSIILDIFNYGDCIEIYARKNKLTDIY